MSLLKVSQEIDSLLKQAVVYRKLVKIREKRRQLVYKLYVAGQLTRVNCYIDGSVQWDVTYLLMMLRYHVVLLTAHLHSCAQA